MKMRRWDAAGLDSPYSWNSYTTCIDHNEVYYFNLCGGNTISSDVDAMKAIIYWYDRRHENGTAVANIDLGLQKKVGSSWVTVRESKDAYDNVERIYWSDFSPNTKWRLRIKGTCVSSDNTGCGQNSMRVRLVQFHEDSDREYWENLDDVEVE